MKWIHVSLKTRNHCFQNANTGEHSSLQAHNGMNETFILVSHDMGFVRDICHGLTYVGLKDYQHWET